MGRVQHDPAIALGLPLHEQTEGPGRDSIGRGFLTFQHGHSRSCPGLAAALV